MRNWGKKKKAKKLNSEKYNKTATLINFEVLCYLKKNK